MKQILYIVGSMAGGGLGWWLGGKAGPGTAILLSAAGSIAGVYAAWRVIRDWLD